MLSLGTTGNSASCPSDRILYALLCPRHYLVHGKVAGSAGAQGTSGTLFRNGAERWQGGGMRQPSGLPTPIWKTCPSPSPGPPDSTPKTSNVRDGIEHPSPESCISLGFRSVTQLLGQESKDRGCSAAQGQARLKEQNSFFLPDVALGLAITSWFCC